MNLVRDLGNLARLTYGLPEFLRRPVTMSDAAAVIRQRLETREERFLQIARQQIYGHPRSPYLALLRAAGFELRDLESLVASCGLEGALCKLREAGVYVSFDEFKGRKEVVRGNQRFKFTDRDFDNPRASSHFVARSGGTRGPRTSVKIGFPFLTDLAVDTALAFYAHGLSGYDHVLWLQGGFSAFVPMLLYAKLGQSTRAWHYPLKPLAPEAYLASRYLATLGRLLDRPLPVPVFTDLQDPTALALRLADACRKGASICVTTYASGAVRIAAAAQRRGVRLDGVCFITLGEPFTDAKQRIVEGSGARALVRYAFTEAGIIGYRCGTPRRSDDLHFFSDSYALIQRPRAATSGGPVVEAFLISSLLNSAPKVLLNVESGDYGTVERISCGCVLGETGLSTHLSSIRSFEKLSSEGMTFVQTDMLRVLEEVLPMRFGGTTTSYQLLEEEQGDGILRLSLLASPDIGPLDEAEVCRTVLEELARGGGFAPIGTAMWRRAGTLRLRRQQPIPTTAGKVLPFHLTTAGARGSDGH
jgi:hypothetical protein